MNQVLSVYNTNVSCSITLLETKNGKSCLGNNREQKETQNVKRANDVSLPVHNSQAAYLGPKHGSSHSAYNEMTFKTIELTIRKSIQSSRNGRSNTPGSYTIHNARQLEKKLEPLLLSTCIARFHLSFLKQDGFYNKKTITLRSAVTKKLILVSTRYKEELCCFHHNWSHSYYACKSFCINNGPKA